MHHTKKLTHLVSLFSIILGVLFLSNCSKDDETPSNNNGTITCSNAFTFTALTGDTVLLSASQNTTGIKYTWTFGDGGTDSVQNPKHHYTANGSYQVCLTVSIYDNSGTSLCTSSNCSTVTIGQAIDTIPPVINLNGDSYTHVSLNTSTWPDPGATAIDAVDGSVSVSSDYSTTNPNLNIGGTYTITYTASDMAGNIGTLTRTVRVKNDAEDFLGLYSVAENCMGSLFNYSQNIYMDQFINNKIHFNKFADYSNNTGIYATLLSNGNLEIPSQVATGIGAGAGACNIADHRFTSVSYSAITNGFTITYTDEVLTSGCTGSTTCTATFTK